jgi:hypothetical protein
MTNEDLTVAALNEIAENAPPNLLLELSAAEQAVLLAQLQLALRIPYNADLTGIAGRIAKQLERNLGKAGPANREMWKRGWQSEYDEVPWHEPVRTQ